MSCPDCKGTGKYVPLVGPAETCRLCGGSGGGVATSAPATIDGVFHRISLCGHTSRRGRPGSFRIWPSDNPDREIFSFGVIEMDFVGSRMLAVDTRTNPVNLVDMAERPHEFGRLEAEALTKAFPNPIIVGPDLHFKFSMHHDSDIFDVWWHVHQKSYQKMVRHIAECASIGYRRFRFHSEVMSNRKFQWYVPVAEIVQ